jgi:hypothetical protein
LADTPELTPQSSMLQKGLAIAAVITAIAVPLVTTFIASKFAAAGARREANVRLVEMAVSILQEEPKPKAVDIRSWAMDVLDEYSGIKLNPRARAALSDSIRLPATVANVPGAANVPSVVGRSLEFARQVFGAAHLALGSIKVLSDSRLPKNVVIHQTPAAGALVPFGSLVDLVVAQ